MILLGLALFVIIFLVFFLSDTLYTMAERKFTRGLNKPGMAAQLRESVSQVVRESAVLNKPLAVQPIDFESFISKNKTLIQNDPQRELLIYPTDDVSQVVLPRKFRTTSNYIPTLSNLTQENSSSKLSNGNGSVASGKTSNASVSSLSSLSTADDATNNDINSNHSQTIQQHKPSQGLLLTRQALHTYQSNNHLVHYKYSAYSGSFNELPRTCQVEELKDEIYEIDADPDRIDEEMTRSQADSITKQGYLYKGPDATSDRMFAHIGSKSFKRRYCYLRQEVDGTYILELHKDEKQCEAKATIVMDFCTEVVQNPKRGRYCFELLMTAGHKSFTLAADNDNDMQDWLIKLQSVLQQNKLQEDTRLASLERAPSVSPSPTTFGTLKGLDQSMNPQLIKYGRETDISIGQARREQRRKLFSCYPQVWKTNLSENIEPYREQFGQRILIKCDSLKFRLQTPVDVGDKETFAQAEPYFTSLALYDAKAGRKLTENFYFDLNSENVRDMLQPSNHFAATSNKRLPDVHETKTMNSVDEKSELQTPALPKEFDALPSDWLSRPKQAIISITAQHPDIFLVVKIEKILQGGINNSSEPYLKAAKDPKMGLKLHKNVKSYSQKIGHYRMPFAFAARPLFRLYSSDLDTSIEFPAIYRQEANKLKDEDLLKLLSEYRKPDKFSKLTVIPGWLKITVEPIIELPNNSLTTTWIPLKPFPMPPVAEPSLEITEFCGDSERDVHPFVTFVNHLFVYPLSLSFDSQKLFSRARNLAVIIEVKDSDADGAKSISCIYGRPGQSMLLNKLSCPVLHHNTNPTWYDEIKLRLPLNITAQHHILFSFVHISCDLSKKRDANSSFENAVGYSWLPLLSKGKINIEEQTLPVAATLPSGYLSIQPLGLGKGNAGPDIQWIDNQRPMFSIEFRLDSTVLTTDQHLHNFFTHSERLLQQSRMAALPAESETCKILKAAHAIQVKSVITFLPTILNQLFTLLVNTNSEEIGLNVIRLLINLIHTVAEEAGRKDLLNSYVKFVFQTTNFLPKLNGNTVHGELCRHLPTLLHPNNTDFLVVNKFMKYSNIFFELIVKSMAQHLLSSGRIRMHRNERFPDDFSIKIENLYLVLVPYLFSRHKDLPMETQMLNKSLSMFIKRCLTFMDRGFVFKLIRLFLDRFSSSDPRTLYEYKFALLCEICSHEHYVPLNLPFLLSPKNRQPDIIQHFTLSEEFCRQHFIAGILLQEVKSSLNEVCHIRKLALKTLKDLMAKHDLDDRYQNKGQLARLAMLYIPWLGIVMENRSRISDGCESKRTDSLSICTSRYSAGGSFVYTRDATLLSNTNSILSTTSTPKSRARLTLHIDHPSPYRNSMYLKDTNYFAAIAGQQQMLANGHSTNSLNSECSAISHDTTLVRSIDAQSDITIRPGHNRSISVVPHQQIMPRLDKFNDTETKDLLICFLFIIKHLAPDHMVLWWQNCTESETISFFGVLDLCLLHFRYVGRKNIILNDKAVDLKTRANKANTLPARMMSQNGENTHDVGGTGTLNHIQTRENLLEETTRSQIALHESNIAAEIGLVILDCMGLYTLQFRDKMLDAMVLPKLAQVYLRFLQLGQSENLSKHVFAALRAFINNFSAALFRGNAALCGQIVFELLKCCDSRLTSIRQESCAVLYLLMRSNFEFSGRKGLTRVHLQVIISVSQMIGNVIGLNNARFQESLSLINSYATSDKAMKGSGFPIEVKDLTKRVRTVLMATAQMQAHNMDPERLLELQHSLANSYASTPELRHTWLITMARNHEQNGNISEAACCNLHIAALMAEYLKLKGVGLFSWGAEAFAKISRNIPLDEKGLKLDSGAPDSQYTEQMLLEQLKECADCLDRAERYECLGELYRLIIPILENRRDYPSLSQSYEHLAQSYAKVTEVNRSGKRMLGRYYRVVFYGQIYFEDDSGVEYIYKEPKLTSLSEISERLHVQYKEKFGTGAVKMIMDSSPVDVNELDTKLAYIQVTHVTPYFCKDELETRQNFFEQNHDVDTFQFETPFTNNGPAHGSVEEQWKRRTILTTLYSFPYVLKRIPVKHKQAMELTPIEVAIDEMQNRVSELEEVVMPPIDVKKLQLRLQGSVAVTVNAGPLAYALAFLNPKQNNEKYSDDKVEELKDIFREFVAVCNTAMQVNGRMICSDQREYHAALKDNYDKLCNALTDLLDESFFPVDDMNSVHRNSMALFSAISGAPNNSSTA